MKGTSIRTWDLIFIMAFFTLFLDGPLTWAFFSRNAWFGSLDIPSNFRYFDDIAGIFGFIIGGFVVDTVKRRIPFFLLFFVLAAVSVIPLILNTAVIVPIYLIAGGFLRGFLWIAAFAFFADATKVYGRGRIAGLAYSSVFLIVPLWYYSATLSVNYFFVFNIVGSVIVGFLGLFMIKDRINVEEEWHKVPITTLTGDKTFLLYSVVSASVGFFWGIYSYITVVYAFNILPYLDARIIASLSIAVIAPFAGFLVDRYGRRSSIALGGFLYAVGFLIFYFYADLLTYMVMAIVGSAGAALIYPIIWLVVAGDLARKESRGRAYAIMLAFWGVANIAGTLIGQNLIEASVIEVSMFVIFGAFLMIMPAMMARETLPPKEKIEEMRDYIKRIKNRTKKEGES
jgi:hypothetical protein